MSIARRFPEGVRSALARGSLLQRFAVTSLLVFVLIGLATGYLVAQAVQRSSLRAAETAAVETLHNRLDGIIAPSDLLHPMRGQRLKNFDAIVEEGVISDRLVVVKVWSPAGRIIYSNEHNLIGRKFELEDDVRSALHGTPSMDVSDLKNAENADERRFGRLLEVYVPIRFPGSSHVAGAFEIYETYAPVAAQISDLQHTVFGALGTGLLVLYLLLFGIVRAGSNTIARQREKLAEHAGRLESSYEETISSLAAAVDARDSGTVLHSRRVTDLALDLGRVVGLDEAEMRSLHHGALLHDVGKIGVPDGILLKPGPLTQSEWKVMRLHPVIGYEMLKDISFLADGLPVVLHHHERWDGTGYPDRLEGTDIPIFARIFAIADAYDAIISDRPYRRGSSISEAMTRISRDAGTHFDPTLAVLFIAVVAARVSTGAKREELVPEERLAA